MFIRQRGKREFHEQILPHDLRLRGAILNAFCGDNKQFRGPTMRDGLGRIGSDK